MNPGPSSCQPRQNDQNVVFGLVPENGRNSNEFLPLKKYNINTEEEAKVVAADWLIPCCASYFALGRIEE